MKTPKPNIAHAAKEPKKMRRAKYFNVGMREAVVASATPKERVTVKMQKIAVSSLRRMQPIAPKASTSLKGKAKNTAEANADKIVKILKVVLELITSLNYTLANKSCRTAEMTWAKTGNKQAKVLEEP